MERRARSTAALVAALAVLAVSAGAVSAGGDGSTAVDSASLGSAAAVGTVQQISVDGSLQSGAEHWQGRRLRFDANEIVGDDSGGGQFEIWRVTEDGRLNQRVGTFQVDANGTHVVDTTGLQGRFVLRYNDQPVYVHDGRGYLQSPPDGSQVTVGSSAWRVKAQTLSFEWSDPTVYPGQSTDLTVESNRQRYTVAVSATGLSFQNLTSLFPASAYANDHAARANDSVLLLELHQRSTLRLDTQGFQPGDLPLRFDVVDTAAVGWPSLQVEQPGADRHLRSLERHEEVGDVVEAQLACTHCFVVLGGPGQGLLDIVEASDANGDGNVTLLINTRYAGMAVGAEGYPSTVRAYTSPEDNVHRYGPTADLETLQAELNYDVTSLNDLRREQGLKPSGRSRPIEPGQYRLTVTSSDFLIDRSSWGANPPLGGSLVIRDETDVETLTLAPRALESATTLAAPGDDGFEPTVASLRDVAAPRNQVALGDRLVFRFDVSGVFGYLGTKSSHVELLQSDNGEGIGIRLTRHSGENPGPVQLGETTARIVTDPAADVIYLVIPTGDQLRRIGRGNYRARLTLTGVPGKYDVYSTGKGHDGYPYLPPGATEEVTATATLAEPSATITEPAAGSSPRLQVGGTLRIVGNSSVAPTSTLTAVASSTEFAWETQSTVRVEANGTWTTELALADAPGKEFDVAVFRGQQRLTQQTYTVRPPAPNATPADGGSGGGGSGGGGDDGGAGGPATGGGGLPIPGLSGVASLAVPVGGGIGILVVVWAAWRFVIRRLLI